MSLYGSVFRSHETPGASEARPVDRFGRASTSSMHAISGEPPSPHRRVPEKSTATMQYEKRVNKCTT
jgi:hypothetical protein